MNLAKSQIESWLTNMKKLTLAISNIVFESNQMTVQIPNDINEVKEWLKENDDREYTDEEATTAYVRAWLFDNVALNYIAKVDNELIILEKNVDQIFSLDAVDQQHRYYRFADIAIIQQTEFRFVADDYSRDTFDDDISLIVFDQLRRQLPIEILEL